MTTRSSALSVENASRCPVCLDRMSGNSLITPCGHQFCEPCIKDALRLCKLECPTCRKPIASHRKLQRVAATSTSPAVAQPQILQPQLQLDDYGQVEVRPAAAVVMGSDYWQCQACTLDNVQSSGRCVACWARRPTAVRVRHEQTGVAHVSKRRRVASSVPQPPRDERVGAASVAAKARPPAQPNRSSSPSAPAARVCAAGRDASRAVA
jgi:hypothetical protein